MGLFNMLRNEFIDIIEWRDQSGGILVQRFERHDHEIKNGAQLVVRPGQRAVFVNEGEIADAFEPGTYRLETKNMPILATLKGWKYGFDSPFKAEVYFINTTELLDRKWGTPTPVMMRDADFGMVRLRARGNISYRVGLSKEMIQRFVGARPEFTIDDMEGQLRTRVVSSLSDCLGEMKIPALELVSQYDEISTFMRDKLADVFVKLGLELISFTVENVSLPEDVQKAMDQRASMGALGNMNQFAQYQAANALRDAANNQGGTGNMMGMMMGGQLAGGLGGVLNQPAQPPAAPAPAGTPCAKCREPMAPNAKFCGSCGTPAAAAAAAAAGTPCVKCGQPVADGVKFCSHCGAGQSAACVKCGKELAGGAKFCPHCGAGQE